MRYQPDYGDKDDRDAGVNLPKLFQHIQPGLVGQTQVQDNDIRLHCGGTAKTFGLQRHDEAAALP